MCYLYSTKEISAIAAKTLKVEFNKAVDTDLAKITLKKGSVAVNVSKVTFSDDKKSAQLELATKLTKGEYTVSVAGLTDEALTSSVTVENEKVAKIEVLNDKAAINGNDVTVAYKVTNQYGEDITAAASTPAVTWTASMGTGATDNNAGTVTIAGASGTFKQGDVVTLTGVESSSGTVVTKTLTVSAAATADQITVDGLYNADDEELDTASTFTDFYLLLDAKDQYGNKINASKFNSDVVVTSSNPGIVNVGTVADNQGPNSDQLGLQLASPTGSGIEGTATITMITKATGKVTTYQVTVKKASTVDTVTLNNPTVVVAAGETVEIPFTAVDQYGTAKTKYSALNGNVTLSATGGSLSFSNDYVNDKAVLDYTAPGTAGTYVLMAVSPTGKVSQINVEVKDAAEPAVVGEVKNVKTALNGTASTTLSASNIKVLDQYGRSVTLNSTFFTNYKLVVEAADGTANNVTVNSGTSADITAATGVGSSVTLAGVTKGTEKIQVSIVDLNTGNPVTGSELQFNEKVVETADIVGYEVADIPTMYDDLGAGYTTDLDIYGKLADGTKVVLPSSQYTVTPLLNGVTATGATLDANTVTFASGATEKTGTVAVVIEGKDGAVTINKDLKVSKVDPEITTLEADSTSTITVDGTVASGSAVDITLANLVATFYAEDQYGEDVTASEFDAADTNVYFTNFKDADSTGAVTFTNGKLGVTPTATVATSGTITAGDSFNMTVITAEGKSLTLKVIAE